VGEAVPPDTLAELRPVIAPGRRPAEQIREIETAPATAGTATRGWRPSDDPIAGAGSPVGIETADMLAHRPSRVTCATAGFKYDPVARDMAFDPAGRQPSNRLVGMITDRDIAFAQ